MANGNGHGLMPAGMAGVPLVGQPVSFKKYSFIVETVCNCGAHEPVLIIGGIGSAAVCPACRLVVQLRGVKSDGGNVTWDLSFGMAQPTQDDAAK